MSGGALLAWTAGIVVLLTAAVGFRRCLFQLGRLALRSCGALMALGLVQQLGGIAGVALGVNIYNAVTLGVLGIPGFALLMMLNWTLK